ncbi:hypothetical protein HJC99_05465 [Candidatus Saccharibacteria bacterium]|nr:hypothetical protein [Candidatus Saccharibacteria bacterium]
MSEKDAMWQERRLEEILTSGVDAASKAQQIIRLGFEPEFADELVERSQLGAKAPMYYESLRPDELAMYDESPIEPETKSGQA